MVLRTISPRRSPELISKVSVNDKTCTTGVKRHHPSRKVIFFESITKTHETYASDEIQDAWYHRDDYQAIQRELHATRQMMFRGVPLDGHRYTARGLEHCDPGFLEDRRRAQAQAKVSVLQAQAQGKSAEEIASDYIIHTRARSMKAYLKGIADEQQARSIASEPTRVEEPADRNATSSPPSCDGCIFAKVRRSLGFPPQRMRAVHSVAA